MLLAPADRVRTPNQRRGGVRRFLRFALESKRQRGVRSMALGNPEEAGSRCMELVLAEPHMVRPQRPRSGKEHGAELVTDEPGLPQRPAPQQICA